MPCTDGAAAVDCFTSVEDFIMYLLDGKRYAASTRKSWMPLRRADWYSLRAKNLMYRGITYS